MGNNCKSNAKEDEDSSDLMTKAKNHELGGDYRGAVKQYKKSIKESGPSTQAYNGLGNVSAYKEEYSQALDYYHQALKVDSKCKYSYNGMGHVYDILRKDQEAVRAYKRSISIDPTFSYPQNGLANFYYGRKQFKEALIHYKEAEKLENGNPLIHANIACCLIYLDRFDESFAQFDIAKSQAEQKQHLSKPNLKYLQLRLQEFKKLANKAGGEHKENFASRLVDINQTNNQKGVQSRLTQLLQSR